MSVFETKTFVSGTKSIIGLEPAKQAVEKHRSDLLAVSERNVDMKRFSPSRDCWSFNEPHEDAEIAIVVERLKTVKEIKGNMRNSQTAERVEKSLRVKSLRLEKWVNVTSTS